MLYTRNRSSWGFFHFLQKIQAKRINHDLQGVICLLHDLCCERRDRTRRSMLRYCTSRMEGKAKSRPGVSGAWFPRTRWGVGLFFSGAAPVIGDRVAGRNVCPHAVNHCTSGTQICSLKLPGIKLNPTPPTLCRSVEQTELWLEQLKTPVPIPKTKAVQ